MNHRLADVVTARALRHGLGSGPSSDAVARELLELARGDRRSLELALTRIERGLSGRSTRVGERACEALEQALVLITVGASLVPVLATFGPGGSIATEATWAGPNG